VVALAFVAALIAVVLNAIASVAIYRSEVISPAQKAAQLIFVWLVPVVGAILALQIAREQRALTTRASSERGSDLELGTQWGGDVGGPSADGSSSGGPSIHGDS